MKEGVIRRGSRRLEAEDEDVPKSGDDIVTSPVTHVPTASVLITGIALCGWRPPRTEREKGRGLAVPC
jgi:hypothetical protein